jgi:hypothetical protein
MPVRRQAARKIPQAIMAAALLLAGCSGSGTKAGGEADLAFKPIGPDAFAVVLGPNPDRKKAEAAFRKHCAGRQSCTIYGWMDAAAASPALPVDDAHYATLAVRYVGRAIGQDEIMWDCVRFPTARMPCLPKA